MKIPIDFDFKKVCDDVRRWRQSEYYHPDAVPPYVLRWPEDVRAAAMEILDAKLPPMPWRENRLCAAATAALLILFFLAGFCCSLVIFWATR